MNWWQITLLFAGSFMLGGCCSVAFLAWDFTRDRKP
jgi:hypothetical protein